MVLGMDQGSFWSEIWFLPAFFSSLYLCFIIFLFEIERRVPSDPRSIQIKPKGGRELLPPVRWSSQNLTQPILKSFFKTKFPFQALTVGDNHLNSRGRNTIVG